MSKNTDLGNLVNGLFVDSSRRVGVGTTSPLGKFNVVDGTNKSLIFQDSGVADTFEVAAYSVAGGTRNLTINAANLLFGTGTSGGTSATERMRITSTGNVGIGTISPTIFGGGMEIQRASQAALRVSCTTGTLAGGAEFGYEGSQGAFIQTVQANGQFSIYTGNASVLAMRITSGGQVSIGTTTTVSTYLLNVKAQTGAQAINITGRDNADGAGVLQWTNQFGTYLGYIEVNSTALYVARGSGGVYITTNATSWTSNSDSRLKNIISPINNAVDKLSTLNPVIYSWKSDNTNKENIGLIAQDVEAIFPQVIDTNKDGYLGVRYTELVPVLVKAIQELKAEIEILKQK
jgi:hypothetical protein